MKPAARKDAAIRLLVGIFILSLGAIFQTRADDLDSAAVSRARALTIEGMNFAYNFEFGEANARFDQAAQMMPQYPRPYVAKAELSFWKVLFGVNEADYREFLDKADIAIDNGEKFVDRYGDNADAYACLGTIYGYRAFAHGRMKSYLKAAWDGKKSYDYFVQAIKADAHEYDAYTGLGVYHYFASFMPKALQWIVGILGVEADSKKGIRELKLAANYGDFSRVDAQYFLAELLPWQNDDFDSSETILRTLSGQYRTNTLFTFTVAVWEMRRNAIDSASVALVSIASDPHNAGIPGLEPYIYEKLAECYFRKEEYGKARGLYEKFVSLRRDELYLGSAYYRLGICDEMLGLRDSAIAAYKHAAASDRKFGDDSYSARRAAKRLNAPLAANDSLLLHAQNLDRCGRFESAIEAYQRLLARSQLDGLTRIEAVYGQGEAELGKGDTAKGRVNFDQVTGMQVPEDEKWFYPWSYYRSGSCALTMKDTATAKIKFEKALTYEDYDFENWLSFRAKRKLEDIQR
jgi:tetratricopeptide (TPR) repeat protein